jgi:hypothetical protein
MKVYTDLEQSKRLEEFLPLESADMYWDLISKDKYARVNNIGHCLGRYCIYAWSLAALFDILPDDTNIIKDKSDTENEKYMCTVGVKDDIISTFGKNPVDVCYKMILKLNELKML